MHRGAENFNIAKLNLKTPKNNSKRRPKGLDVTIQGLHAHPVHRQPTESHIAREHQNPSQQHG